MAEAVQEIGRVLRGTTETHNRLRERIVALVVFTVVVDLVCSVLAWRFERTASGTDIHTWGDALFWTSSQLLTVSSSMKNPLNTGGRLLDVGMEIYAITVVATLAGAFAAFLHERGRERRSRSSADRPAF